MFREIAYTRENALELEEFKKMDYYTVENYQLPIELMMENAGLQLANLIAFYTPKEAHIRLGAGNGNNGGGGLVAARRLMAWNYSVSNGVGLVKGRVRREQASMARGSR